MTTSSLLLFDNIAELYFIISEVELSFIKRPQASADRAAQIFLR